MKNAELNSGDVVLTRVSGELVEVIVRPVEKLNWRTKKTENLWECTIEKTGKCLPKLRRSIALRAKS